MDKMEELCQFVKKMGQSHSQNTSYSESIGGVGMSAKKRSSFRSPFLRRKNKQSLSATFTAPIGNNVNALNINTATVEQLMTLPGITRQIAQQIFEHRKAIGGRFQRVDDLALVSGIGAEKLEKMRPDICIKRTKHLSNNSIQNYNNSLTTPNIESSISSRTDSLDSIASEPVITNHHSNNCFNYNSKFMLNINKASVFELQQLHEMNQEVAANVIDYRLKKGCFIRLDDLTKVKGMNKSRLGAIRPYLTLNDEDLRTNYSNNCNRKLTRHPSVMSTLTPNKTTFSTSSATTPHSMLINPRTIKRKSLSLPIKMNIKLSNTINNEYDCDIDEPDRPSVNDTPVNDIFDLLGAYSHRPIVEDDYRYERNGFSTIRLTTWNLERMCFEKSENLGVKEVICRTILENRLSILCLQEILDARSLKNICDELNAPKLKRVKEWRENSKNWKYFTNGSCNLGDLNGLGFIYDADFSQFIESESIEINFSSLGLTTTAASNEFTIQPTAYLAAFKLSDWTCYVLNIYLRFFNLSNLNLILNSIELQLDQFHIKLSDIFLVVGDFSGIKYKINDFYKNRNNNIELLSNCNNDTFIDLISIKSLGFSNIIDKSIDDNSTNSDELLNNKSNCNILCREKLTKKYTSPDEILLLKNHKNNKILKVPLRNSNSSSNKNGLTDSCNRLTGHFGIIKKGLCHMAIPNGWTWGGSVSEYQPIWLEIYRRLNRNEMYVESTPIRSNFKNSNSKIKTRTLSNGGLISNGYKANSLNISSDSVFIEIKKNV